MLRRLVASALVLIAAHHRPASAGEDPRFAADFGQGLRDRGYYELALDYYDQLRKATDTPAEVRKTLDYEEGRTLIAAAAHSTDPDASREKLDLAKIKIEAFVKANPDAPETTEALVELAHLLYERGRTEVDLSGDARNAAEKDNRLAAARGYYASARDAYGRSFDQLKARFTAYPKFIPANTPQWIEKEKVHGSLMRAELQRWVVDYNEAQTYPADAKERTDLLTKAVVAFEDIYKRYRNQMASFTARMYQGKCFEEQGKLGEAMGIFKELMDHPDPALRPLQKQVAYYEVLVMAKRQEFALAADTCRGWLDSFPKDRRSYEALGIQFELAKDILAQVPKLAASDRDKAIRLATDHLANVVRVVSPFKPDALALLKKNRPTSSALLPGDVAKLSYDEAMAQGDQALSLQDFEKAIPLFRGAIRKAEPTRDPGKANRARFMLAFCCHQTKRYYEAAVLDEFMARRYPSGEWSPKAAEIAMDALVQAYNTYTSGNRTVDLDRLIALARYTAETWPDAEQGDFARLQIGLISQGFGKYDEAVAAFETVRPASSKWIDAQAACGGAHWKKSESLRVKGDEKGADAEAVKAVDKLKLAIKSRKDANTPETDPSFVNDTTDLAGIDLETGKAAEALALLEPIARKLVANRATASAQLGARVVAGLLRAHVAVGKVDQAIEDMKTLESLGGAGNGAAPLYFELSSLLEKEVESLRKRGDKAALERTEAIYKKFLEALVASKSGQSFRSLRFAADNLLKLGSAKEANDVYARLLDTFGKDPEFLKTPNASTTLFVVKIRQIEALREMGDLSAAEALLDDVSKENKPNRDIEMARGYLLDAKAEAKQASWVQAHAHWQKLAVRLSGVSPKPTEYYEAWYRAAVALKKQGKADLARQTIAPVMKLSRDLGGPEWKAKYQELARQIAK